VPKIKYKYVFGPVPSRRLGRSLGVDLFAVKTCTQDCVYCQLGGTAELTVERREYVPADEVIAELKRKLAGGPEIDAVTISGSGEPTLHSGIGKIIQAVKKLTDKPVAVITNGTLLADPSVRRELAAADIVMPSLDACDAAAFAAINRPHPKIDFDSFVKGLARFRTRFAGKFWLEVFLVAGLNDSDEQVEKLKALAHYVDPDEIHLNTLVRPAPGSGVERVSDRRLQKIREIYGRKAKVIAPASDMKEGGGRAEAGEVLALISRRPVTAAEIAAMFKARRENVEHVLGDLLKQGAIKKSENPDGVYYIKA
jgi:wyosine [tRNA(Phe)-imidazoG37] synthetase (radical SAM superfamily)